MNQQIVHIVDDDEAIRDSLSLLLDSVAITNKTHSSAQEFLNSPFNKQSGCIILDVRMPKMSGLELQQELKAIDCQLPIIFITGHGDIPMAVEAMKHGAEEFIQKPFRDQDLIDCINRALQNNSHKQKSQEHIEIIKSRVNSLTIREKEVMDMVIAGHANKVIAIELNLSPRTVEIHRARVMEKMHVKSLADLVRISLLIN